MNRQLCATKTIIACAIASWTVTVATVQETVTRHRMAQFAKRMRIGIVSFMLLTVGLQGQPAYALPATDEPSDQMLRCLGDAQGSLTVTPQPVDLWQNTTLSWNVNPHFAASDFTFHPPSDARPIAMASVSEREVLFRQFLDWRARTAP